MNKQTELEQKLDLSEFLSTFRNYFSREKSFVMEGDSNRHLKFIESFEGIEFSEPPKVEQIWESINAVKKFGTLSLSQIYEIVKITKYFFYLKKVPFKEPAKSWIEKINIDSYFSDLNSLFDNDGNFRDEADERLRSISLGISEKRGEIRDSLSGLLNSKRLEEYLVDRQIHYLNDRETLLLKGGFNSSLKGSVIGRSANGYFYVQPDTVGNFVKKIRDYEQERERIYLEYRREISKKFQNFVPFLKFIDRQFDVFDHYQARYFFARSFDLQFIKPEKSKTILIKDFYHPAIKKNPKPLNIDFSKSVLMVTGVNAGGKTMLLKSILSTVYLAKYLLPMKIDSFNSKIGSFKNIESIIDDPQNINFDISTFAGRMVSFAEILKKEDTLIGVDEVELGTDSDEASALFKVLIEKLIERNDKIVITTHHKRLASLLGSNENVELVAAIYDEEKREPTYRFLQGIVGKSYAFETAERYGIPKNFVSQARIVYGEDSEKLNELIEKSTNLEQDLIAKNEKLAQKLAEVESEKEKVRELQNEWREKLEEQEHELQKIYKGAISEAKVSIKAKTVPDTHRHMTEAHKLYPNEKLIKDERTFNFQKGDKVRYKNSDGKILQIRGEKAKVEIGGMRVDLPLSSLQKAIKIKKPRKVQISIEKPKEQAFLRLDLHGKRRDEALEELDQFISNALLQGWEEIFVTHGIGGGILAKAVNEFLREHPRVHWFGDAPPNMGGQGAKIIKF
jgi:DNA mismatch repair protein MutS2